MSDPLAAYSPGTTLGTSPWFALPQDKIDAFAELTEDRQFIHTDPARAAAESGFGGTIAHGYLTLSMLSAMAAAAVAPLTQCRESVNYGFDKLRFLAPVPSGSRVRGTFVLDGIDTRPAPEGEARRLLRLGVTVEIEGQPRPALVAEWLVLLVFDA